MSGYRDSKIIEDTIYQTYIRFFEIAEGRRRWNLFNDIPWEKANPQATELLGDIVEQFCGVELYLPDYTGKMMQMLRRSRGRGWFLANWGYEESKHSLTLEKWLIVSGKRTEAGVQDFSDVVLEGEWDPPFSEPRQMMIYGMIQELATHVNYKRLRQMARDEGDEALATALRFIAIDEMAHFGFYRDVVKTYLALDEDNTRADIAFVFKHFTMPAQKIVPGAEERARRMAEVGVYGPREYIKLVKEPIEAALGLGSIKQLQRQYLDVEGRPRSFVVPDVPGLSAGMLVSAEE
jgi:acyl-[acyl-carrier-protein] desaturase